MQVREHPVTDHRSLMEEGVQLVDVREPIEVMSGTLAGALNIPLGELPARVGELDPTRRVLVLCRSGQRSGAAARWLVAQGFGDVVNLDGGMLALERIAG